MPVVLLRMEGNAEVITKPPYSLPSMADIAAVRGTSGLKVASTFSGCGGSCLGFEEAGFEVVWANEFVPIAQDAYAMNHAHTILDRRDVRNVSAADILEAVGLGVGELDVFNGSPPCQAFSTVGKRHKGWGSEKEYEHGVSQKNETLFDEYIRLLNGLQPKVFVAENVSGLAHGKAAGIFKGIGRDLSAAGYDVKVALLDAQWLGIPQTRLRLVFVGVRNDLVARGARFEFPKPFPYYYSVQDAIPWVVAFDGENPDEFGNRTHPFEPPYGEPLQWGASKNRAAKFPPMPTTRPCECISTLGLGQVWEHFVEFRGTKAVRLGPDETLRGVANRPGRSGRGFSIVEIKRLASFPDDFKLPGSRVKQWNRIGNSVPPRMMNALASAIRETVFQPLGMVAPGAKSVW